MLNYSIYTAAVKKDLSSKENGLILLQSYLYFFTYKKDVLMDEFPIDYKAGKKYLEDTFGDASDELYDLVNTLIQAGMLMKPYDVNNVSPVKVKSNEVFEEFFENRGMKVLLDAMLQIEEKKEENDQEINTLADHSLKVKNALEFLSADVKGQDTAINKIVQALFSKSLYTDTYNRKGVKNSFVFVGPPGCGKTMLATKIHECLGVKEMFINMSDYTSKDDGIDLFGTSSSYGNSTEGRLLTFVEEHPDGVIILDEIEKAHPVIIRKFLMILDQGEYDNKNKQKFTSFKNITMIFTTNAGKTIYEDPSIHNLASTPTKVIVDALRHERNDDGTTVFPESILSRFTTGNIIMFNRLNTHTIFNLITSSFDKEISDFKNNYGYSVTYNSYLPLIFMYSYSGRVDARIATRRSREFLTNEFYEIVRQNEEHKEILDGIDKIELSIDVEDKMFSNLLTDHSKMNVLVVCEEREAFKNLNPYIAVSYGKSYEEAKEILKGDIDIVFVDPYFGLNKVLGVALDDCYGDGMNLINDFYNSNLDLPVYLLNKDHKISDVDASSLMMKGVYDVIDLDDHICDKVEKIREELFMEQNSFEFSRKGLVLEYNTGQNKRGNVLEIKYHGFETHQAMDLDARDTVLLDVQRPKTKFNDIIGANKAKKELNDVIGYLKNPNKYLLNHNTPPKGILLYGPPGTGKTMLARAMAGESDVTYFETSATKFMDSLFGQSEKNIRQLFHNARKYAPSIIFIDEIDTIGKERTGSSHTASTEQMLNALLTEMDGFQKQDPKRPVFVLAATNFGIDTNNSMGKEVTLDDALLRRFDNHIYVDLPDENERIEYLKLECQKNGYSISEEAIQLIADRTPGLTISKLKDILELASKKAEKKQEMEDKDLYDALDEWRYGEKEEWSIEEVRTTAYHEAGHAYISRLSGVSPTFITIISRGNHGGYTIPGSEDKMALSKEDMIWKIRSYLAGRASESVFFGEENSLNTGASNDLEQATKIALYMVCKYGMSHSLISLDPEVILSTPLASDVLNQVNDILNEQMVITKDLCKTGKEKITELAEKLLDENELNTKQIEEILGRDLIWVDRDNKVVGYGEKIYTHKIEQLHRAFSLFILDDNNNMLLQLRAKDKYHSGGLWSNACCSHPYRDEEWNDALMRCMKDELGTSANFDPFELETGKVSDNLEYCGSFVYYSKYDDLSEHEYDHVFVYHCDEEFKKKIQLNPDEIERIEWVSKDELEQRLCDVNKFTTWFPKAYEIVKKG